MNALLVEARENAWSFSGLIPPNRAEQIAKEVISGDTYYYYRDQEGNFWYDTERGRRFEKEMRAKKHSEKLTPTTVFSINAVY